MRVTKLQWDDENIDHIARYGVTPAEAMQACRIRPKVRRGRDGRYVVVGRTIAGRHLLSSFATLVEGLRAW